MAATTKRTVMLINCCASTLDIFKSVSLLTERWLCSASLCISHCREQQSYLSPRFPTAPTTDLYCSYTHNSFQTISVHCRIMKIIYQHSAEQCCEGIKQQSSLFSCNRLNLRNVATGKREWGMTPKIVKWIIAPDVASNLYFPSLDFLTVGTICLSASSSHHGFLQ